MTQPGFGSQAACLWVPRCPPSPASLDTLGPPFCWYRILPRARPAGIERLGLQAHLCTCCRPALHMFGISVSLSFFFYAVVFPKPPSYSGVLPLHLNTLLQPPCSSALEQAERGFQPHPCRKKDVHWGQGPGHGLEPPQKPASLSQCSHPVKSLKSRMCWRSAQGVLKGFRILF